MRPEDVGGVDPAVAIELDRQTRASVGAELDRLRAVWSAFGCASNPDDFKATVRERMWDQVCEWAKRQGAADQRLAEENRALRERLARVTARVERAEAQVERVRGLADEWDAYAATDEWHAADCWAMAPDLLRAALAETETGHQTRPEAPESAEEAVSRVPGPDGVREAGRRAGAIVDSEGAW